MMRNVPHWQVDAIGEPNQQSRPPHSSPSAPRGRLLPSPTSKNVAGERERSLSVRIGIDSGMVVVGAGSGKEADVFGEAPNIAARVQGAADPGTVLITEAVQLLVSGLFVVENRGAQVLKGVERPVQLYRVVQPSGVRGRLGALAAARALTPFVGRESELRLLGERWELAREGAGQMALIIGEAGIGKSRLLQRFQQQIANVPHALIEAAATPFFQNTPFYAVAEVLRQLVALHSRSPLPRSSPVKRLREGAQTETQLAELESALIVAGLEPAQPIPLIAPLLELQLPAKYPPSQFSAELQRRRLLAMLVDWLLGAAQAQPLAVAIEDLHWTDASTLDLIQLLVEQGTAAPLLLLCTARSEFRPQWPLRGSSCANHAQSPKCGQRARNDSASGSAQCACR